MLIICKKNHFIKVLISFSVSIEKEKIADSELCLCCNFVCIYKCIIRKSFFVCEILDF